VQLIPFFSRRARAALLALVTFAALAAAPVPSAADTSREVAFSIPAQRADAALTAFAKQAGLSVLYPYDAVAERDAHEVVGTYDIARALDILLAGTDLEAVLRDGDRLTVRVKPRAVDGSAADGGAAPRRKRVTAGASGAGSGRRGAGNAPAALGGGEEITVTGSRIRRDDFSNPQPTTVITAATIQQLGFVNLGDAMTQLPSNLGTYSPTAKPGGNESFPLNVFNGASLANLRGLNPAYGARTLVLVDSRRHVPTNQGDGVDLNFIPTVLIDRMEIVTGGASASYGSGAIGGVVNVLLDRDLDGARAQLDFGATGEGDGHDVHYGFGWGTPLGRTGHLVAGVERQNMDPIVDCIESRDWCAKGAQIQLNRHYAANADPNYVYREDVRLNINDRGVLPRLGLTFDATGTQLLPFETSGAYNVGGDGEPIWNDTTLRSGVERSVGYASYSQELGERLSLTVDASVGSVTAYLPQDSIDAFVTPLRADNFYLTHLAANPCAGAPASSCVISKDFTTQAHAANDTQTDLKRVAIGFAGQFGDSSWTWDAYYQYGRSQTLQAVYESRHSERFNMALDAVDDGAGNPVCRVARDGFAAVYGAASTVDPRLAIGCVPIDIFGLDGITPAAYEYTHGRILENTDVEQDMVELVASGELARGFGAGPIRAAAGASWRDESIDNPADQSQPDYIRTDYQSQFGGSFAGKVAVSEYFGELDVPVTERFRVQLAARRSDYENTAGHGTGVEGQTFHYDIDTWKVNGDWHVTDAVALRVSQSRDSRAPNFRELYYRKLLPSGSVFGFCSNPWTGNLNQGSFTFTGDECAVDHRGGLDLKPEKSDTTTFGIVLAPPKRSVRLAVDYFRIDIADAITPAASYVPLDGCYLASDPFFCAQISGTLLDAADPLGGFSDIVQVSPVAMNLRSYQTRGIDVSADWQRGYRFGTIATRVLASRMIEQLVQPSASSALLRDVSGVTGRLSNGVDWEAAPDWTAQWITSFARDSWRVTTHARYVSAGRKDWDRRGPGQAGYDPNAQFSIDGNRMPSHVVWGLSGSYALGVRAMQVELFGAVENLLDEDPPLSGLGVGGTNPVLFDTVGRNFRVGVRASF
jgi:outer membrane receptor protein involved in Fe transport